MKILTKLTTDKYKFELYKYTPPELADDNRELLLVTISDADDNQLGKEIIWHNGERNIELSSEIDNKKAKDFISNELFKGDIDFWLLEQDFITKKWLREQLCTPDIGKLLFYTDNEDYDVIYSILQEASKYGMPELKNDLDWDKKTLEERMEYACSNNDTDWDCFEHYANDAIDKNNESIEELIDDLDVEIEDLEEHILSLKVAVDKQVRVIQQLIEEDNKKQKSNKKDDLIIVVADCDEDNFHKIKGNVSYFDFVVINNLVATKMRELNLSERIVFHKVKAQDFFEFIKKRGLKNDSGALALFASTDYNENGESKIQFF